MATVLQSQVPELAARLEVIGVPYASWGPEIHDLAAYVVANYTNAATLSTAKSKVLNLAKIPPELRVVALAWVDERYAYKGWTGGAAGLTLPDGTTVLATKTEANPLQVAAANLAPTVFSPLPPAAPPPPPPSTIIPVPTSSTGVSAPIAQPAAVPIDYSKVDPVAYANTYQAPVYQPPSTPASVVLPIHTGVQTLYSPPIEITGAAPAAPTSSNMVPLLLAGGLVVAALIFAR